MIFDSATQHKKNLDAGRYSSTELTQRYLEQIKRHNPALNALVFDNSEAALRKAKECDQHYSLDQAQNDPHSKAHDLPLLGVPITIKESFKMRGTPTTLNYPPLKNYRADEDAIIVDRLQRAGAIILGKTNVPTLLSDSQTFGPIYPRCNNPYDPSKVPGGSTGGGAAAIASGMTTFEIGSDIAGSIRNPAHYCGLFGLKPTQNNHYQDGHIPPLPSHRGKGFAALASTGPLARNMDDIDLAYRVCYAPRPEYRRYLSVNTNRTRPSTLSGLKIAYYDELLSLQAGSDVQNGLEKLNGKLTAAGASLTKIQLDHKLCDQIVKVWAKLFGFMIGQDFSWLHRQVMKMMFNKDLRGSRLDAKGALATGLSLNFKAFSQTLYEQQEAIAEFYKLFDDYNFIISPTSPGPAFGHNPKHRDILLDGEAVNYIDYAFMFVSVYNALEMPVLTIPTGANPKGLPIGLSIAAPHYCEEDLIALGKLIEAEGFHFTPPSGY